MNYDLPIFISAIVQIAVFAGVWRLMTQMKFWSPLKTQLEVWEKVRLKGKDNFIRRFLFLGFPYTTAMLVLHRGSTLRNDDGLKDALIILTIACLSFIVVYYLARSVWSVYEKEYARNTTQIEK
ncbi:MAG TPA: hypothetical protein VFA55_00530 [Candidatus Kapabacteria bacterium]|nr:hypothetical protein [Candidatus Kapabacteria bacterium]